MNETLDAIRAAARGLLSFAGIHLALAPGDLRLIEATADLSWADPPERGVGWISALGQAWPVYSLSFDLAPLVEATPERRMCAVLGHDSGLYGLLCEDIQILRGVGPRFQGTPPSARGTGSPIKDLAIDARGLLCGANANDLARFIGVETGIDRPCLARTGVAA